MNRAFKTTLRVISALATCVVVLLAFLLAGVRIFGIEVLTILSPSMEPKYPTGSLIYLVDADPSKLQVNDVITFRISPSMTATHRIIEVVPDAEDPTVTRFRTKGDSNNAPDGSLVEYGDIVGKPVLCIPYLGYLAQYVQTPPGSYVAVGAGLVLILFVMTVDAVTGDKTNSKNPKTKGDDVHEEN